jgi:translation initiation factor 2 alpha subunit (eIF-2alpha)
MIHFYNRKTPKIGDVVVVVITTIDKEISRHKCILPEYGNIEGIICRAELNRSTAKIFKKLSAGKTICTVCTAINSKNDVFTVDLSYMSLDKEIVQSCLNNYDRISRIIDVFAHVALTSSDEFQDIDHSTYKSNQNIVSIINTIVSDSIHNLSVLEIEELFFKNTQKLHQIALTWSKCLEVPNFLDKLIIAFPKPDINLDVIIEFKSTSCFGIKKIQQFVSSIKNTIREFDADSTVEITIITVPQYRIVIKSSKITFESNPYIDFLKQSYNIISMHLHSADLHSEIKLN